MSSNLSLSFTMVALVAVRRIQACGPSRIVSDEFFEPHLPTPYNVLCIALPLPCRNIHLRCDHVRSVDWQAQHSLAVLTWCWIIDEMAPIVE